MFVRSEIKSESKQQLKGKWAITGGLFLLMYVVIILVGIVPYLGMIAMYVGMGPIMLSLCIMALKTSRYDKLELKDMWSGFQNFGRSVGLYYWMLLWVVLWMLLFYIPGIIKGISYSMSFFILADNPDIGIREALNESKRITEGHKWELFVLYLSFMGWSILATLTFGIGYFWLFPYMQVTYANAYKKLANK